jgi:hypothetical protein
MNIKISDFSSLKFAFFFFSIIIKVTFILILCFMASKTKIPSSQRSFLLLLFLLIAGIGWYVYLFIDVTITKRLIAYDEKQILQEQNEIAAFSDIP